MCGGFGACGACSVIVDGKAILSCMVMACECDGKTIETSEGIAAANHPLIDAFIMGNCMQCGYCVPGFVTTSKALLDKNPNPTADEVTAALRGNLCRCHIYPVLCQPC
jgi:aerobic-type carbon monoxide dehydrogenase small subunit (CoxS/CutS family)